MQTCRWIAGCLIATLAVAVSPVTALAGDDRAAAVRRSPLSRDAIDKAVGTVVAERSSRAAAPAVAAPARTPARAPRVRQGGGKGMMIMTIVSTVVGLGATYYLLKEMNKNKNDSTDGQ